ncbi:hypothetical protein C3943_19800 [Lysinibacillus sp. B2A1]|nr:hypothetical protein C3943_19800 [Lysinibacillus sp. B2A1]
MEQLFSFIQQMFFVSKAKRQLQLRQGEIDLVSNHLLDVFCIQTECIFFFVFIKLWGDEMKRGCKKTYKERGRSLVSRSIQR